MPSISYFAICTNYKNAGHAGIVSKSKLFIEITATITHYSSSLDWSKMHSIAFKFPYTHTHTHRGGKKRETRITNACMQLCTALFRLFHVISAFSLSLNELQSIHMHFRMEIDSSTEQLINRIVQFVCPGLHRCMVQCTYFPW